MAEFFRRLVVLLAVVACGSQFAHSQTPDSRLPDSPSQAREARGDSADSPSHREVSWRSLPKDFFHDQKGIWLSFPAQLAKGHYWLPTLAVVGGTAGLIVADPHVMPYFRSHARNLDDVNDTFDAPITSAEVILLPASLDGLRLYPTRLVPGGHGIACWRGLRRQRGGRSRDQSYYTQKASLGCGPGRSLQRHFFCWRQIALQRQQFSVRACCWRLCRSHSDCDPVPHPSLGALGSLRIRDCGQLFPDNQQFALPLRCLPGGSPWLHHHALPGAAASILI